MNVQETAAVVEENGESILPLLKKYIPGLTAAAVSALMNRATLPGGYFRSALRSWQPSRRIMPLLPRWVAC